jgi:hypothetical protein
MCNTNSYKDYNNPVLTIHHLGKYNKYRISLKIKKFNYKNINL